MSKILVSMWVWEDDRDLIKILAAKEKKLMPDIIRERIRVKKEKDS